MGIDDPDFRFAIWVFITVGRSVLLPASFPSPVDVMLTTGGFLVNLVVGLMESVLVVVVELKLTNPFVFVVEVVYLNEVSSAFFVEVNVVVSLENIDVVAFSKVWSVDKISVIAMEGNISLSAVTLSVVPSYDCPPSTFVVGDWNVVLILLVDNIVVGNFFVVVCGVVLDFAAVVVACVVVWMVEVGLVAVVIVALVVVAVIGTSCLVVLDVSGTIVMFVICGTTFVRDSTVDTGGSVVSLLMLFTAPVVVTSKSTIDVDWIISVVGVPSEREESLSLTETTT